jgi:hypothetical protein
VSWFNSFGTWQRVFERAVAGDDTGGILYAVLLKAWMAGAGDSELALRLPSVCAMVALVGVLYAVALLLWNRRTALAVGRRTPEHANGLTWTVRFYPPPSAGAPPAPGTWRFGTMEIAAGPGP